MVYGTITVEWELLCKEVVSGGGSEKGRGVTGTREAHESVQMCRLRPRQRSTLCEVQDSEKHILTPIIFGLSPPPKY